MELPRPDSRDPQDPPNPGRAPVPEAEPAESSVATMTVWLRGFQRAQDREIWLTGRYGDDVTVNGRVEPLPSPYQTKYNVHETGKGYWVQIRNPESRQLCKLEDGRFAQDPREIICYPY